MNAVSFNEPVAPVVDIKQGALDDGPGIRSVVFFKGCPFRCVWCQNPETLRRAPEIQRDGAACLDCGACLDHCPTQRARPAAIRETGDCTLCGACTDACPTGARRLVGREMTAAELFVTLSRDAVFYRHSGGGVTFSGGEPTLHLGVIAPLAAQLRRSGIPVLVETCGHFPWRPVADELLPHVDTVYFDLKLFDPEEHRRHVGVTNELVHTNLRALSCRDDIDLLPRVPLIPGITTSRANLEGLASLLCAAGLRRVALLPYNPLWIPKRAGLGLAVPYDHDRWMERDAVDACRAPFLAAGLDVV